MFHDTPAQQHLKFMEMIETYLSGDTILGVHEEVLDALHKLYGALLKAEGLQEEPFSLDTEKR